MVWKKKRFRSTRRIQKRSRRIRKASFRRRPPIHRTGVKRPTGKFWKVSGLRKPVNRRSEIKSTKNFPADFLIENYSQWYPIWVNNSTYNTWPSLGAGADARIGTKVNFMYVDIRFCITFNNLGLPNHIADDYPAPVIPFRIVVVKYRNSSVGTGNYPNGNVLNEPFDSKLFDIQFDRTFQYFTGTAIQWFGAVAYQQAGFADPDGRKFYHMKIPLRATADFTGTGNYTFENRIDVSIVVAPPDNIIVANTARCLRVTDLVSKLYYLDT